MTLPTKQRITVNEFRSELPLRNEMYANGEIEVIGEYIKADTPIEVKDKYGITLISPSSLLKNAKPRLLAAKDKDAYFRAMLLEVWGEENFPNIITKYERCDTKLKVEKDGFIFLVRSNSLLIGNKYDIPENADDPTAFAIHKLKKVHGDRYDYSKFVYGRCADKVTIICKEHGEFEQTFADHLGGAGCTKCSRNWDNETDAVVVNKDNFLQKMLESNEMYKAGELKVLSHFEGIRKHILVEDKYGVLSMTPRTLLNNIKPDLANAVDKTSYYINKVTDVHKGKYTYENAVYLGSKSKITVTCPIHGDFKQEAISHLMGKGCTKCKNEKVGWTYTAWSKAAPGNPGILYALRCWNETEEFYKVGITCQTKVSGRYHNKFRMPYNYEIIQEIVDEDRKLIYKLEKEIKRKYKDFAYTPQINFDGSKSECFNTKIEFLKTTKNQKL